MSGQRGVGTPNSSEYHAKAGWLRTWPSWGETWRTIVVVICGIALIAGMVLLPTWR